MLEKKQTLLMAGLKEEVVHMGFGLCLSVLALGDSKLAMAAYGSYVGKFRCFPRNHVRASVEAALFPRVLGFIHQCLLLLFSLYISNIFSLQ